MNECGYPMCPASKDASMELERHQELRQDLVEIKANQGKLHAKVHEAVVNLEKIALAFVEINHIKNDVITLNKKVQVIEDEKLKSVWDEVHTIKNQRLSWAQSVILVLITGGVFGVGGFFLARLWVGMFGGE